MRAFCPCTGPLSYRRRHDALERDVQLAAECRQGLQSISPELARGAIVADGGFTILALVHVNTKRQFERRGRLLLEDGPLARSGA